METIQTVLLLLQVLVALSLIGLILLQHGKGADAGAAFGSGASGTVFGSRGSGNFMTRSTAVLAFAFLMNSLGLAWIANNRVQTSTSIMDRPGIMQPQERQETPTAPSEIPAGPGSDIPSESATEVPVAPE